MLNLISNIKRMDRTVIHQEIRILIDKIAFLNERLSEEKYLHPVEADLLDSYVRELQTLIDKIKAHRSVREDEESVASTAKHETEMPTSSSAGRGENEEIKMHQHILDHIPDIQQVDELTQDSEDADTAGKAEQPHTLSAKSFQQGAGKKEEKEAAKKSVSLNERFRKDTTDLASRLSTARKKNLKNLFDVNQRYSFITGLFGGSTEQFNKALHELAKCASREEAEAYIRKAELEFAWNEKNELAARFKNEVLQAIS
ncbi:MAG: hypothetical protein KatS3mg031_2656 [Chitinophagales bacterium]|nr:MAG: hypothetical protein KatS3mg031_2656 [Chitinophagales bacterium]